MGLLVAFSWCFAILEFLLFLGGVFFKDLFNCFQDFSSKIEAMILVTPKQEVELKSKRFCGGKFCQSNLKVKCFLAVFLFTCGILPWIFTIFPFFSNKVIVPSRSRFSFRNWKMFELQVKICHATLFCPIFLLRPYYVTITSNLLLVY